MLHIKIVDNFEINNFVTQHFFRISYILAGKWNFQCLQKSFLIEKPEPSVKNGWSMNFSIIFWPLKSVPNFIPI